MRQRILSGQVSLPWPPPQGSAIDVPERRDGVRRGVRAARERRLELRRLRQRVPIGSKLLGERLRDGLPGGDEPVRHGLRGPRWRVHVERERRLCPIGNAGVQRRERGVLGLGADLRGVLVAGQWCVQRDG